MTLNNRRRIGFVFFLGLMSCLGGCEEQSTTATKSIGICYIPISSSTYAPVSLNELNLKCTNLGMFAPTDPLIDNFLKEVRRGRPLKKFDDTVVRMSLRFPDGKTLYLNKLGEVEYNGRGVEISAEYLAKIDKNLYEFQQKILED